MYYILAHRVVRFCSECILWGGFVSFQSEFLYTHGENADVPIKNLVNLFFIMSLSLSKEANIVVWHWSFYYIIKPITIAAEE